MEDPVWYPKRSDIDVVVFELAVGMYPYDDGALLSAGAPIVRDEHLLESPLAQP